MKRILFTFLFCFTAICAMAQLRINNQGRTIAGDYYNTGYQFECRGNALFSKYDADWEDVRIYWDSQNGIGHLDCPTYNFTIGTSNYYIGTSYLRYAYLKYSPIISSDARLKENIKPIDSALEKILKVSGKSFNYISNKSEEKIPDMQKNLSKTTFGFIAQELKEVIPELVEEPSEMSNYYGIDYIAIIPLLVEAMKEQQQIIDSLRELLTECCTSKASSQIESTSELYPSKNQPSIYEIPNSIQSSDSKIILYQNKPNPFTEATTISCFIPISIKNAQLCIFDMQGNKIECINILERNNVDIPISARSLAAGIYTYMLIADNGTSEAKQMIITH